MLLTSDSVNTNEDVMSGNDGIPAINIFGVKVNRVDMNTTLSAIRAYVRSGKPHMIVTADSYALVLAQTDEDFRSIVNNADLVTPDSSGILLGAKWLGTPLIGRVSGIDIAQNMCKMAAEEGFSVFLLGAAPGVADMAAQKLKQTYLGLAIAGTRDGYFKPEQDTEVVSQIRDSGAQALFVALGIPKQEKWIRDHMQELGVSVAMGVGGSFDVISGKIKRAPVWMQRACLEWAYRLLKDPRKIYKVAVLPRFLGLLIKEKFCAREKGLK